MTNTVSTIERDELPVVTLIGTAHEVVLGLPGGGFDGPHGMSEPEFEFEPDGGDA